MEPPSAVSRIYPRLAAVSNEITGNVAFIAVKKDGSTSSKPETCKFFKKKRFTIDFFITRVYNYIA